MHLTVGNRKPDYRGLKKQVSLAHLKNNSSIRQLLILFKSSVLLGLMSEILLVFPECIFISRSPDGYNHFHIQSNMKVEGKGMIVDCAFVF